MPIYRIADEEQVNTYTDNAQTLPQITGLAGGGWVVTWYSVNQDSSGHGVYQQAYAADGTEVGVEMQVNTYVTSSQTAQQVTPLSGGGWVVTWQSFGQDGDKTGIYQQVYRIRNGEVEPVGVETPVNTYTTDSQSAPQITDLGNDSWVVTWESTGQDGRASGLYQQVYRLNGSEVEKVGVETWVNTDTPNVQFAQVTALKGDQAGRWVVTWYTNNANPDNADVYQQVMGVNGDAVGKVGAEKRVNTHTSGAQSTPQITALSNGGWVVTWESFNQDGSFLGVYQQVYRFNGDEVKEVDGEKRVNTYRDRNQSAAQITALSDDRWVVTWASENQDGSGYGIYQQMYRLNGSTVVEVGGETPVNTYTTGSQSAPQIMTLNDGGWVVTWESSGQDGGGAGVYQQIFAANGAKIGGETRVNAFTPLDQGRQQMATTDDGWVVTWRSFGQDGSNAGIYQRRYEQVQALGAGSEYAVGDPENDIFDVEPGGLTAGDTIEGGEGTDTVWLTAGGTLDLTAPAVFTGIEEARGSTSADRIIISEARLAGIQTIDGDNGTDTLALAAGGTYAISGLTLSGIEAIEGSAEDDTVILTQAQFEDLDSLAGGSGIDTLRLASAGTLDLTTLATFDEFNVVQGSGGNDLIVANADRLSDLSRIDGGDGDDDVFRILDDVDLSDVTIDNVERIELEAGANASFDDKATALLVSTAAADASLTLIGATFTEAELGRLFRQGLRMIDDADPGTYIYAAPSLASAPQSQTVAMTAQANPFAGVTLATAPGLAITARVTFTAALGELRNLSGGQYDPAAGTYEITGTAAEVQAALRALAFDPRDRVAAVGTREDTVFTLTLDEEISNPVEAARVTITSTATNLAPGEPVLSRSSVQENARAGTLIGELAANDPNPSDALRFELSDDAGGRFALDGNKLVVKQGAVLDYESARSHEVRVKVLDAGGLTVEKAFTVAVTDVLVEQVRGTARKDVLKGGLGQDAFVFDVRPTARNADTIQSFVVKDDAIWLENAIYKGLGKKGSLTKPQQLTKDAFFTGTKAGDAEDRIIYDRKSGKLYYDVDGTGAKAQVLIAQMQKVLRLTEKDFFVI